MLDFKTQSQLVDATAAMMRACLAATTHSWTASAHRGLSLWADMLGAGKRHDMSGWQVGADSDSLGQTMWPSLADWMRAPQLHGWPSWVWLPGNAGRQVGTPFAGSWPGPTFTLWMPLADWTAWKRPQDAMAKLAESPTSSVGFSSYRSDGGHAVAQIAMPAIGLDGNTAALSPVHTMLGVWRAALGG
jgi:hypothetical protein